MQMGAKRKVRAANFAISNFAYSESPPPLVPHERKDRSQNNIPKQGEEKVSGLSTLDPSPITFPDPWFSRLQTKMTTRSRFFGCISLISASDARSHIREQSGPRSKPGGSTKVHQIVPWYFEG